MGPDLRHSHRRAPTCRRRSSWVDRHPDQTFVLDHLAKPRIRHKTLLSPWRENIRELARRPNVFCKLSGMVSEADYHAWGRRRSSGLTLKTVLESFGPGRLMFGSDWPVWPGRVRGTGDGSMW